MYAYIDIRLHVFLMETLKNITSRFSRVSEDLGMNTLNENARTNVSHWEDAITGAGSQEDSDAKWHDGSASRNPRMNTFKNVIVTVIPWKEIPRSLPRSQIYTCIYIIYICVCVCVCVYILRYTHIRRIHTRNTVEGRRCIIAFKSWYIVHRVSNATFAIRPRLRARNFPLIARIPKILFPDRNNER